MKFSADMSDARFPRLDLKAPVAAGVFVVVAFFGFGIGTAAVAPIDKGVGMPGTIIVESRVKPVQHERGGTVGRINVREGQQVTAGDVLLTLETKSLIEQTTALRLQADAAARQLDLAKQESETMLDLLERKIGRAHV